MQLGQLLNHPRLERLAVQEAAAGKVFRQDEVDAEDAAVRPRLGEEGEDLWLLAVRVEGCLGGADVALAPAVAAVDEEHDGAGGVADAG